MAGDVGSIDARSAGSAWTGSFVGEVGVVQTSGDFAGTLAASSLHVLAIGRGLLGAHIEIGATLGADGRPGGLGTNADSFGAGYLGQLRVGGSLLAARVHVGVDPVNGVYDDGDDLIIGGPASRIQTIIIGGRVDGASRIVAGALPATLHVGGRDTAAAKTRRFATGAGGLLALTAGLDGAPAAQFVDLMVRRATDGSFALSKADLDVLAGGALSEGPHVLHVVAVDASGNARSTDIAFTLSHTQITAALANDTGISASDGHTKVQSGAGLASLVAAVDGGAAGGVTVAEPQAG